MAKGETPKGRRKSAAKKAPKKAVPKRAARKVTATQSIVEPAAHMKQVRELSERMLANPGPTVARQLEAEAAKLETFFASIRNHAQQFAEADIAADISRNESVQALLGLKKTFVLPSPPDQVISLSGPAAGTRTARNWEEAEEVYGIRSLVGTTPKESKPGTPADTFDLAEFFRNVSRSVIDAQKELDRYSLQYARQQSNSAIPPALYSIPSVHAEIKAGLSKKDGSGILVQLLTDKSESDFTESTISFDVVASPPAPGGLRNFTAPVPEFLVVEGKDKARVMSELGKLPTNPPFDDGWEQRTVIIRDLDPLLRKLNKNIAVALVFGRIPKPEEGEATDFTDVPVSVYRFSDQTKPEKVDQAGVSAELVRILNSLATWIESVTVPG